MNWLRNLARRIKAIWQPYDATIKELTTDPGTRIDEDALWHEPKWWSQ